MRHNLPIKIIFMMLMCCSATLVFAGDWRSIRPPGGGPVFVTIMPDGNSACASYNGTDCLWGYAYNQIDFRRLNPLVCGEQHRLKWGVTGYEDPKHWCSLARRTNSGSPQSPPSQQPTESEYDRRGRESREEIKNTCKRTGGVYEEFENGQSCGAPKPKVSMQPRENEKCRNYARRAIDLYQEATSPLAENRGCNVQTNNRRWNPNYQIHYNWCLKVQDAWLRKCVCFGL
jgi:hypothetical protein